MNVKKINKFTNKIRKKYCIGTNCKECAYKDYDTCLNKLLCKVSCMVKQGDDIKEKK